MKVEVFNKQGVLRIKLLNEDFETLKKAGKILEKLSQEIVLGGGSVAILNVSMASTALRHVIEDMEQYKIED
jgi:methyl coenzyme M reductase subunit C-like uncharacterized protein (methanogenesis marker protein 7)